MDIDRKKFLQANAVPDERDAVRKKKSKIGTLRKRRTSLMQDISIEEVIIDQLITFFRIID